MALRLPIVNPEVLVPPPPLRGDGSVLLRVGDLAQRTQKTVRALHLYEELGLLQPIERSKGGFRLYSDDAVLRVRWISRLQDLGFSLPDIRELVSEWERSGSATGAMAKIRELYQQKLLDTELQLQRLGQLRDELRSSVAYLETCDECEPARLVTSCPQCDLHGCGAPELVAGLHGPRHD
jgi:DNA-binding transcriptional MerR regulator